jgi:hypothetical protein
MSIQKLNKSANKHKFSVLILYLVLTSHFLLPSINRSEIDNTCSNSLVLLNNFIDDEVSLIIGKSHKFSSTSLNGRELINVKETKLIIEKNKFFNKDELKYYFKLDVFLAYLELPDFINFIPRSPPQILS